ncbi:antibiotic biosynthesis monooxygenase family protein [Luteimonas aquatica]|uniref:antibiotic biosynthesis monooxygenase family protein n=1 Tax=Luteimonas aquatica TaxID=450364 RepID=UPI001F59CE5C|nr:antibiotic biosynthesis monooxygenase [Luteimonas aquatica]
MIARLWHGTTLSEVADDYLAYLLASGVADYRATPGNLGVQVLQRREGRIAHFLIVSTWESLQAIEGFAGADLTRARYYPEDDRYLLAREERVQHYEIAATT